MTGDHCIIITAAYEPHQPYGRSLGCIAPELRDALTMIDNHADEHSASRTWAGIVDESTFGRFAAAWRLADQDGAPTSAGEICTFDGMNWELDGGSPIIYVTVEITPRLTDAVDAPHPARTRGPLPGVVTDRSAAMERRMAPAAHSGQADGRSANARGDAFVANSWLG